MALAACNAAWAPRMSRKFRVSRDRRARAATVMHGFAPDLVTPVGLTFKFEVEELPPETSPFHRKPGEKRPIPSPEQTQDGAQIGAPVDKIDRLDWTDPGDIFQFVAISAVLIFFFWFTNYYVPQVVFKDVFAKAEEEQELAKQEAAKTAAQSPPSPPPPPERTKINNKRYRTFKKKTKEQVVIDV
ncbi:hypothetical protein SELMODRAFT_422763 [Selaginella moellendorffii]|uniref:Uncharacterized protein n=1 Tax=Selaginella moellendorffii TaxID=88036 RepID=D8SJG8_SELML|nr:uncharacterized protein LOC9655108 [Selaginella moellendorffii]EFJ15356.1 hypothetical protein SELMODRAFT_422763 [Selaginella moellendorffii]|eukprot:XP_002983455.1 uncharacterized protein LOC9655108 [Selaginella moellendorffii]